MPDTVYVAMHVTDDGSTYNVVGAYGTENDARTYCALMNQMFGGVYVYKEASLLS